MGYAINWTLGIQHVFAKDFTLEVRYIGNRGVHLLFQDQINRIALVTPSNSLPLYYAAPTAAVLNALPLSLTQLHDHHSINNNIVVPVRLHQHHHRLTSRSAIPAIKDWRRNSPNASLLTICSRPLTPGAI